MSYLTKIDLENFTAFGKASLELSPGVNVLVGANGSGKTHLLKVAYAACAITSGEDRERSLGQKLRGVFAPFEGRLGRLSRRATTSITTKIAVARAGGQKLSASFSNHTKEPEKVKVTGTSAWTKDPLDAAYIPVKEMLAHAPGFLASVSKRELAFEEVYSDIVKRAYLSILKGPTDKARGRVLAAIQKAIDGKVVVKGEHFFLKNAQGELEFSLLAEGVRKLALIWILIQNGMLLSGTVLFWDEPEANLNPLLMGEVVEVILELQRLGVQVVLTTHNYVLLKEFDLRARKGDMIRYFSLYREKDGAAQVKPSESYLGIDPNAIASTFSDMYNRDMKRALEQRK